MSSDINKHKQWLRDMGGRTNLEALAAIEALEGEVARLSKAHDERLKQNTLERAATHKQFHRAEAAEARAERLRVALGPFARFAKMFADAREHKQGHVPVEPDAEWYARETKHGLYVLTPGMFDEALRVLEDDKPAIRAGGEP
jgi:hypothetical protein